MRFLVSIVDKDGVSKKHMSTSSVVRMDDNEEFRLLFESEWKLPGRVVYCYDGSDTFGVISSIRQGDIIASKESFIYRRTSRIGDAREMYITFLRDGKPADERKIFLINNDYYEDGTVVHHGQARDGKLVIGRTTRHEDDPDLFMREMKK
jgi:hypothetical protein|uniref:Uncharacterized protein n=1 Tax=viral metagenome TaxID=1070528 RepID=A0A6C0IX71_9ZZZZ